MTVQQNHQTESPQHASLARTVMFQGTASDVGKSILTAAFCRIWTEDGYLVAPFKSQNMSNNSYVTWDGKEIGRAQGMQADACGILATTDMNPILLKPKKDMIAQVVIHGRPLGDFAARVYREQVLREAEQLVKESLAKLRSEHDIVVLEGAGSPAEINLKSRDIVNMRAAGWADAPVVLVADIDRGGMFAAIVGTLELLEPHERDRVCGFIVNKFRGDVSLLQPGLDWLEQKTGKPVLGVVPFLPQIGLEDEDSLSLDQSIAGGSSSKEGSSGIADRASSARALDIAVIRLPHISNFTDMDPLQAESDVRIRYIADPKQWGEPDAIIIPGSKNTVDDLLFLRSSGLAERLRQFAEGGGHIAGICGGYEMLGRRLLDPMHAESDRDELEGLGWFPFEVVFAAEKRTEQVEGTVALPGLGQLFLVEGYEIHMGEVRRTAETGAGRSDAQHVQPFRLRNKRRQLVPMENAGDAEHESGQEVDAIGRDGNGQKVDTAGWKESRPEDDAGGMPGNGHSEEGRSEAAPYYYEGCASGDGRIWGTFLHGVMQNDDFRRAWLNRLREQKGWEKLDSGIRYKELREASFHRLAEHVRRHVDIPRLNRLIGIGEERE